MSPPPPEDKKLEFALYCFHARRFCFFHAFFFVLQCFFSFALASAKARKHEKSAGAQLCIYINLYLTLFCEMHFVNTTRLL